jgi:hypothetical protein
VTVSGRPVQPQTTHLGAVTVVEPRAINSVTNRPIAGGAPTVSASGSASRAVARLRHTAGLVATAATAAATSAVDSDISTAVIWEMT